MRKVIHYCGEGVAYMLPGWPVCKSGDFAIKVREQGNQSRLIELVTCKNCIKKLEDNNLMNMP